MNLFKKKTKAEQQVPQPIVDEIQEQLTSSISWKRSQGYYQDWPEYERFKRGEQWPAPTADTVIQPRPVINIFESILDQKQSAVLSEEPQIAFLPREGTPQEDLLELQAIDPEAPTTTADDEAADMFTKVAEYCAEETGLDELNESIVDTAATLGTAITYWYWDTSKRGGNSERGTAYEGEIAGEEIDPADIHFGNPRGKDIQKQPWIIITSRTPIDAFREFYREHAAKLGVDINSVQPSKEQKREQMYDSERAEIDSTKYVDEIRRFRKVYNEGTDKVEVWYEVVADGKLVRAERPLFGMSDLYPLAVFRWKNVRNCVFGEGESRNIIEAQKALNRLLAMAIWNGYLTAWARLRTKKGAVDKNRITNRPGEIIEDSQPGTWNVDYMNPPAIPSYIKEMFSTLPEMVKTEAGVHEAMVGAAPSGDLNAQAIMALQKAAGVRISKITRSFRRYLRDVALIWQAFWKEFYTERRLIRITEDSGRQFAWFRGTDYIDFDFDVQVTSTPTSSYSEGVVLAELKELLQGGFITPQQYLENVPKTVLPMADKILQEIQEMQETGAQMAEQGATPEHIIQSLPPEQQQEFMSLPPEVQQQLLQQAQGGM